MLERSASMCAGAGGAGMESERCLVGLFWCGEVRVGRRAQGMIH